jgi:biotin operon repressor
MTVSGVDPKPPVDERIEKTVLTHIQALRARGHTTANTTDIARALGLSTEAVEAAVVALAQKGLKRI